MRIRASTPIGTPLRIICGNAETGAKFARLGEVHRPVFGVSLDVFHLNRFCLPA